MKKIVLVLLTFILFLPVITKADTVDYDIKNYYINADILKNGDMEVTELIVLKGSFNGYIREIVYQNNNLGDYGYENNKIYNGRGMEVLEVSAKKVSKVSFATFDDSDFQELEKGKPSNYGYLENDIANGKSYKMYFKANGEMIAFKITYIIKDVVVLHKDVAELYWTFIGNNYEDRITDLQIRVNLPEEDESNYFRVWAHGDMAGEVYPYDNRYLLATIKNLDSHNPVDVRTTFDASLMDKETVTKVVSTNALDGIIEVEKKRADIQNEKRQQAKKAYYGFLIASIIYYIVLIAAWVYVYFKYDKEYKSMFKNEYNRDFIDDYNVEVVDYLMNKNITPNALSASIMNLLYKKVIAVEEIPSKKKKKKDYKFTLKEKSTNNETENYLIDFLFNRVGYEGVFTTEDLNNYAIGRKTCEKFSTNYTTWKNKVIEAGKKENFFESNAKAISISIFLLVIASIMCILTIANNIALFFPFINIFLTIIFLIYTCVFFKRTKKGNEDYARWKSFKKFLNDFGTFDAKELPEVALWERYMVYATVFGLAKKVSKVMNVKIKELEEYGIYNPTYTDWYIYNSINSSVNNSVHSNVSAVNRERANSASSSGSGFGGGFSSGGGFGGGGGGGHGF